MNIIQTITSRKSTRTFLNKAISEEEIIKIKEYIKTLNNPFGGIISYEVIKNTNTNTNEKLGTYGIIKNPSNFIIAKIVDKDMALEALGYEMEELILYLSAMGIGSCWLGGTFNRGQFAKAVNLKEGELIPVIVPIGYIAEKKSMTERVMRKMSKGDFRKDWQELFFLGDFSRPLSTKDAGSFVEVLEMVRLGPSASNKQP